MTVSNVVSPLMTYFDRFIIGALLPVAAVAYYVTPFEAVMKLLLFPSALMGVLFPAFATSFASDRARTAQLFDQGVRVVMLVVFPVSLTLVTLAFEILRVWVGAEFARAGSPVLQWLAVGALINSVGFVGFAVLQGVGRADLTGKLNLIELPFYLVAIWLLARTLGLAGVAMAWTLRVFVDTVALSVMARRNLVTNRRLLRTPVMTWLTMAFALLVGAMLPGTAARIAYVFAAAAVYLPVAWFGLVTPSERRAVWRIVRRSVGTIDDPTRQAA
jgi:O-antigen/teichoic acid export membrane protein